MINGQADAQGNVTTDVNLDPAVNPAAQDNQPHIDDTPIVTDPRKSVMDEIFAKRNRQIEQELGISLTDPATGDEDTAAALAASGAPETDPAATHTTPQQQTAIEGQSGQPGNVAVEAGQGNSAPQQPAGDPQKKVIVVNGQRMEVTDDDLIRMAQMGMSAQQRFEEAARMRREAEAIATAAHQPQQHTQQPQAPAHNAHHQAQSHDSTVMSDDEARDIALGLNYGSEEEQAQAIRKLANRVAGQPGHAQQSVTPQQIASAAAQQALAEIRFQNNLQEISTEFQDVFQDRILSLGAADRVNALRNFYASQGVAKPDIALYREACQYVRQTYVRGDNAQGANPAAPANPVQAAQSSVIQMNDRIERKRAAPQPPAAANRIAKQEVAQAAPTASSIVAQMRKSRHQPVY